MAHIRMWAGDYTLSGLVGFELRCKTVGVLGTGAIGAAAARIFCVSPSAADLPVLCQYLPLPPHKAGSCRWRRSNACLAWYPVCSRARQPAYRASMPWTLQPHTPSAPLARSCSPEAAAYAADSRTTRVLEGYWAGAQSRVISISLRMQGSGTRYT